MQKKRVLFVDDEAAVLEGLQNLLRRDRNRWELHFATSAKEGLEKIGVEGFDVVVSDVRMPVMDGVEFLGEVKESHPEIARIVLSGFAEREAVLRSLTVAHQFLSKPCDIQVLRGAIERICEVQTVVLNPLVRKVIGAVNQLPTVPAVYIKLEKAVNDPAAGIVDIAEVVQTDPALAAKVLQLVNSAYFGVSRRITSIADAVMYLGVELLKTLTLTTHVFAYAQLKPIDGFSLEALQSSSIMTARLAQRLVPDRTRAEEAFSAGMLHDLGLILLAQSQPEALGEMLARAKTEHIPLHVLEMERFGVTHAEIGAYLLGLWGLPFPIIEAVALHHRPGVVGEGSCDVLAALHVADALTDHLIADDMGLAFEDRIDGEFIARCGLESKVPEWRKTAEQLLGRL